MIPAPGQPARLPFWRGDDVGRPAELGAALGAFTGELAGLDREAFDKRCAGLGFNAYATDNLWGLLDEQRTAAGVVPTDTTLLVERFRDELGDWRVILHSPYGLRVHGPLALAVGRRLRERYGIDEKPTASDDGIVVRLPDTLEDAPRRAPNCSSSTPTRSTPSSPPKWAVRRCSRRGSGSARPARCCCRAGTPADARRCGTSASARPSCWKWPANTPTSRWCWRPSANACRTSTTSRRWSELMAGIAQRRVRVLEAETARPSPFAASLLFGYVGAFMYEGDTPLAERRAAALSLDSTLLAELLGRVELRELLDPEVIAATGRQLQHLSADRAARDAEAVADLLRLLGPLTEEEVAARAARRRCRGLAGGSARGQARADGVVRRPQLVGGHRGHRPAARRQSGRRFRWACRPTFTEEVADPLGELLGRYARTRTPFTTARSRRPVRPGAAGDGRRAGPAGRGRPAGARRLRRRG